MQFRLHSSLKFLRLAGALLTRRRTLASCQAIFVFASSAITASTLYAQDADVIRGRVTGPNAEPVAHASVVATTLSGGVNRTTTTDNDGRYSLTFANGDGDYWVTVTAVGYTARRMEVKRLGEQQILIGDMRLQRSGQVLDSVRVTAPMRQRATRDTGTADIGGTETRPITEVLTVDQLADLALLAGSFPGVQIITNDGSPSTFSVLGLTPEQNQTTLNGMRFNGTSLPRDAAFEVSLAVSPYDVSRGGFSGAQLALRSRPPTNLTLRANSLALDAPQLQWTDAAGRTLGQEFNNLSLGGVVTTPIRRDRSFLHVAYQASQRFTDLRTLLDANSSGLNALGLATDSLTRLRNILTRQGVPLTVDAVPALRKSNQGLLYGAVDLTSPSATSGRALNVMYTGSWSRQSPAALGPTSFPAQGGTRNNWQGGVQMRHTGSFGFGMLSETQVSLSGSHSDGSRYVNLPSAQVRIVSNIANNDNSIQTLSFGGSAALDREQGTSLVAAANQLSWFSRNNKHRLKLSSEVSRESLNEQLASNTLGTFRFNSLADLEAGRPSAFVRQMVSPRHDIANYRAGLALSDGYSIKPSFQILYGVRVDLNRFQAGPVRNAAIESAFGARNDVVPNRIDFSPRVGFAWSYGTTRQVAAVAGAARAPRATIRGGMGIFQGVPSPVSLTGALDNTGLPNAARQLTCNGPAAPAPNWMAYRNDVNTIPSTCLDGAGAVPFTNASPGIVYYDKAFAPPSSVRGNVQWSGEILDGRFQLQVDATESINLSQAGFIDRNFLDDTRFTMPGEGNRPVFVAANSIDTATGSSSLAARRTTNFGTVTELRSDLRSESRQLTLNLTPLGVHSTLRWNVAYVLSSIREQTRGFSSTAGNPLSVEWSRSGFDSRHQFIYSLGYNVLDMFRVSWSGSFRSGQPFGAYVDGDINGDGRNNDRAFIPDPARMPTGSQRDAMERLLATGSRSARSCLRKQLNRMAARNNCEGPWTSSASLNIALNPVRWWHSNRLDVALQLANPLGAADLLLHGDNQLRGWGQSPALNDILYYVNGFNRSTQLFSYDVNPRFGDASASRNTLRNPVVMTAIVRFDFGPTRERQSLTTQLDRGRRDSSARMSEAALKSLVVSGGVFNPIAAILRNSDTLRLSSPQADSITLMAGQYTRRIEVIWTPIVKQLAALPERYNRGAAYDAYVSGRRQTIDLLSQLAPRILGLLSESQRRALPVEVQSHLNTRYLATIRSGTAGLGLAFLPGVSAPTGSTGGGGALVASPRR